MDITEDEKLKRAAKEAEEARIEAIRNEFQLLSTDDQLSFLAGQRVFVAVDPSWSKPRKRQAAMRALTAHLRKGLVS